MFLSPEYIKSLQREMRNVSLSRMPEILKKKGLNVHKELGEQTYSLTPPLSLSLSLTLSLSLSLSNEYTIQPYINVGKSLKNITAYTC